MFLYLDRTYALREVKAGSLWSLGLELFKTYVANISNIRIKTINELLALIELDRYIKNNEKYQYLYY